MPWMQAIVERANMRFNRFNIDSVPTALFEPGRSLVSAAVAMELATDMDEMNAFGVWPSSVQEAVRATLFDALCRENRVPVQFAWTPAGGYGAEIWEASGVNGSATAITIVVKSPLPPTRQKTAPQTG